MRHLLSLPVLLLPLLLVMGCGAATSEKSANPAYRVDLLSFQITDQKTGTMRILYVSMLKAGDLDILVGNDHKKTRSDLSTGGTYGAVFDDCAALAEHWLLAGPSYTAPAPDPANPVPVVMVTIELKAIDGVERELRLPVTQANADKFQAALLQRLAPFIE